MPDSPCIPQKTNARLHCGQRPVIQRRAADICHIRQISRFHHLRCSLIETGTHRGDKILRILLGEMDLQKALVQPLQQPKPGSG